MEPLDASAPSSRRMEERGDSGPGQRLASARLNGLSPADLAKLRELLVGDDLRAMAANIAILQAEVLQLKAELKETDAAVADARQAMNQRLALVSRRLEEGERELRQTELLRQYRQHISQLQAQMHELLGPDGTQSQALRLLEPAIGPAIMNYIDRSDREIATRLAPMVTASIRRHVRESRDDVVDAIYPVMGRAIQRAVSEAIRQMARNIDASIRQTLSPAAWFRRLIWRLRGVDPATLDIRSAVPFHIIELLLIHNASGLLMTHAVRDNWRAADRDLVSGMLTAIRDFARDSLGDDLHASLDEIQYGERRIVLVTGRHAYLACLVDGVEPMDFRLELKELLVTLHKEYEVLLENYTGSADGLEAIEEHLHVACERYSAITS